jgi:hypothetical protein
MYRIAQATLDSGLSNASARAEIPPKVKTPTERPA